MANGIKVTPPISSRGLFEVEKPFKLDEKRVYEVIAIREFDDLWANHTDIYRVYYAPFGLAENIYQRDIELGAAIVALKSDTGIYHIPDTFIVNYPEMGYTQYKHIVLSVSLGAVHQKRNLAALMEDISNLVSTHLGVKGEVRMHIAPTTDAITERDAVMLEKLRSGNLRVPISDALALREATNRNASIIAANNARLLKYKGTNYNKDKHTAEQDLNNYVMRNLPSYDKKYTVPNNLDFGGVTTNALTNLINAGASFYDHLAGNGPVRTQQNPALAGRNGASFQLHGKQDSITSWLGQLF